jgi:hypothetical protein
MTVGVDATGTEETNMGRLIGILGAVTILPLLFAASSANAAAVIRQQAPCNDGGQCANFSSVSVIPTIRTYSFAAPGVGTAAVTLNGTMQCANFQVADGDAFGVIDLSSQIVEGAAAPNSLGPGGARYPVRIPKANPASFSNVTSLAITRVFIVTAGTHAYSYKMTRNRMDVGTTCAVYNAYFTVVFVPK